MSMMRVLQQLLKKYELAQMKPKVTKHNGMEHFFKNSMKNKKHLLQEINPYKY